MRLSFIKKQRLALLSFAGFALFLAIGAVSATSYSAYLDPGEYYYVNSGQIITSDGSIDWSFSGSNSFVGIIVMIFDQYNFQKVLADDMSAEGYVVSDGSYYSDYGYWTPSESDVYTIVFFNLDPVLQSTSLNIGVEFDYGSFFVWFFAFLIDAPAITVAIVIGIIVLIAAVVLLFKYLKKKSAQKQIIYAQTDDSMPPPVQSGQIYTSPSYPTETLSSTSGSEQTYCIHCGAANSTESTFCMSCGQRMQNK